MLKVIIISLNSIEYHPWSILAHVNIKFPILVGSIVVQQLDHLRFSLLDHDGVNIPSIQGVPLPVIDYFDDNFVEIQCSLILDLLAHSRLIPTPWIKKCTLANVFVWWERMIPSRKLNEWFGALPKIYSKLTIANLLRLLPNFILQLLAITIWLRVIAS